MSITRSTGRHPQNRPPSAEMLSGVPMSFLAGRNPVSPAASPTRTNRLPVAVGVPVVQADNVLPAVSPARTNRLPVSVGVPVVQANRAIGAVRVMPIFPRTDSFTDSLDLAREQWDSRNTSSLSPRGRIASAADSLDLFIEQIASSSSSYSY